MAQQVLIATLGSEPQVVTLALDLLRAKGYPIAEVIVVHTTGETVRQTLGVIECKSGAQEQGDDLNAPLDKLEARIYQFRALRVNPNKAAKLLYHRREELYDRG